MPSPEAPGRTPAAAGRQPVTLLSFHCTQCGNCCRVPGYVYLREGETEAIAGHLGLDLRVFTDQFTRLTDDRSGLSLVEAGDGACVFLGEDNRCRIQSVKPHQCREFPERWRFDGFEKICPGVVVELR